MTLPIERTRAVIQTERFLMDLANPSITSRIPKAIRDKAYSLLRHYPSRSDFILVEEAWEREDLRSIAECPFTTKDSLLGDLK